MFAHGVNDMMNYKKNRIICFSDSAGTVMVMTIRASILKPNEIEEIGSRFQKELDWLTGLDDWNDMYKREFGPLGEYDLDDHDYKAMQSDEQPHAVERELIQPILSQDQIKKTICDETFNWYINRRGPQTRLGKLKYEYIQREKQYMVEAMMKKKNVSQKQFDEYYDGIINKSDSKTEEISIIRSEADKKYRDIINKLLAANHTDEYKFDPGLKRKPALADQKLLNVELQKLWTLDFKIEREKFIDYVNKNHYKSEEVNWDQSKLVLAVISALYEAGIIVRYLTSDGTSTNLKTYKNLSCCLDPSNLKSSFTHPEDPYINIQCIVDPCHLMKICLIYMVLVASSCLVLAVMR
ncbi:uncharacterized protein LOC107882537 [Acyrthosiphon pisum]|uniref:Uncharacterized protein n=1 Tax=Acyrthosiphon pisum TaxID=7029 RepID=A0A8R2NJE5_ACYPI|nr:uncharacterized protein LOC107882537 [Acyrthosiphon pisum]